MIMDREDSGNTNTSNRPNVGYGMNGLDNSTDMNIVMNGTSHMTPMNNHSQPSSSIPSGPHHNSSLHSMHLSPGNMQQINNPANLVQMQRNAATSGSFPSDLMSSGHSDDSSIASPETYKLSPPPGVDVYKREMIDNDCY